MKAKSNTASEMPVCLWQNGIGSRSTGKERDAETGLDYFGARFYSGAQGRFITPDPLMASARASNPQTWNRYNYTLNNPLRFVDPDGLDVPDSCANDENCVIQVKLNIVWASNLTDEMKKKYRQKQLDKTKKDFGHSNIQFKVTETEGKLTLDNGKAVLESGFIADALNVYVSGDQPAKVAGTAFAGPGILNGKEESDLAVIMVNAGGANNRNLWPFANTTEHEMVEQFQGWVYSKIRSFEDMVGYIGHEFGINARLMLKHGAYHSRELGIRSNIGDMRSPRAQRRLSQNSESL